MSSQYRMFKFHNARPYQWIARMTLSQLLVASHTIISVIAIVIGAHALKDLFWARASSLSQSVFIGLALATSASGFILPLKGINPAMVISVVALVILAAELGSRGRLGDARWSRWIYAGELVASEDLLIFVGVVQAFMKVLILEGVAPTRSEPPFAAAQGIVLVAFVVIGILAIRAFRPQSAVPASFPERRRSGRSVISFPMRRPSS